MRSLDSTNTPLFVSLTLLVVRQADTVICSEGYQPQEAAGGEHISSGKAVAEQMTGSSSGLSQ